MAKKTYTPDYYASYGTKDSYGTIYSGMMKHKAFRSLTLGARMVYVTCRVHSQTNEAKRALYKFVEEFKLGAVSNKTCFVFTTSQAAAYDISAPNKSRYMHELEKDGFIKVMFNNYERRKPNLYAFADGWKKEQSIAGDAFGVDQLAENEGANDSDAAGEGSGNTETETEGAHDSDA